VTLLGFSDGGEEALLIAEERPDLVRAVATWGSAGKLVEPPGMIDAMASLIDAPIPPMQGFAEYLKAAYGEANARVMTQSFAVTMRAMVDAGGDISWSRAGEIRCPVLLITGQHDFLAAPTIVEELASRIPAGRFALAEGASHDVYGERPEWLQETLVAWLASTETEAGMRIER
jgi:valacyclovir hydrolase